MEPAGSAPPRPRRSLLDLGPRARVVFALVYVFVMAVVIVGAQFRPDHVFGFQMFNQASNIETHLFRRVRGKRKPVPVVDGTWQARDRRGTLRTFRWNDRIKDPVLGVLDRRVHARYGLEGQLFRVPDALEDVLAHLRNDAETTGLLAEVWASKNGREPELVRFEANRR